MVINILSNRPRWAFIFYKVFNLILQLATLIPVAVQNMGGGNAQAKDFGDAKNLIAAFLIILIIVAIEVWTKGFLRSISVLIGLVAGTAIASFMGLVSLKPVMQASWFHLPQLFYFGVPEFVFNNDHHCIGFYG